MTMSITRDDVRQKPAFHTRVNMVRPVLPPLAEMQDGLEEILRTGIVTKGPYLQMFEQAVAEHLGVKHAIGVSSCTTGLMLTYRALGLTGDAIVPSFTFMATVSALVWAGLRPNFADVDPETADLDPEAVEQAITPTTTAIVGVHVFGNPADIEGLQAVADRHGLALVFDAAHGFGALYRSKPVGPQGRAQVYSLSPTKLLIAGEGGIVATDDDELAERVRVGREYGNSGNYDSAFAGMNARLAEINALMGLRSLAKLEEAAVRRNRVAALFREELGQLPGIGFQDVLPGNRSSYKDFSITVDANAFGLTRDQLAAALTRENIDTRKYFDPPVHRQTAYREHAHGACLKNTDMLAARSLSLPIWSHMDDETAMGICAATRSLHERAQA